MKKFTTLIIVDASGSMENKVPEVIGGLKQLFADIKTDAEKSPDVIQRTIIIDFSSSRDIRVIVDTTDISLLTDNLAESYTTRGATALYDAIAHGFSLVGDEQDGVFVNIITDGEENDSKVYRTPDAIKPVIDAAKGKQWAIVFMGTSEEAVMDAARIGISIGNTYTYTDDSYGMMRVNKMSSTTRTAYYTATTSAVSGSATFTSTIDLNNLVTNNKHILDDTES